MMLNLRLGLLLILALSEACAEGVEVRT